MIDLYKEDYSKNYEIHLDSTTILCLLRTDG